MLYCFSYQQVNTLNQIHIYIHDNQHYIFIYFHYLQILSFLFYLQSKPYIYIHEHQNNNDSNLIYIYIHEFYFYIAYLNHISLSLIIEKHLLFTIKIHIHNHVLNIHISNLFDIPILLFLLHIDIFYRFKCFYFSNNLEDFPYIKYIIKKVKNRKKIFYII